MTDGGKRRRSTRLPLTSIRRRLDRIFETNHGTFHGWLRSALSQTAFVLGWFDRFIEPAPHAVRRLVFVCLGNMNRSAFAAAVALRRDVQAVSIGLATFTGSSATSAAVHCADGFGVDLGKHEATDISDYDFEPGDLLLVMEMRHARRLINRGIPPKSIALLGHWSSPHRIHLHDPHTLSDLYFRTSFTLINSAVNKLVDELIFARSPCVARPTAEKLSRIPRGSF